MKISVITPVYNRADCIEKCMDSVSAADKSGLEIEHVICDDGSSDDTASIVERYASAHPHVKFVKLEHNSGPNAARNAAIAAASGEWILILDSDDTIVKSAFRIMERTLTKNPGYKHYMFCCDDRYEEVSQYGPQKVFSFEDFLYGNLSGDFAHLFKRSTALAFPFDEKLRIHEFLFFLRFYEYAGKILFTAEITHQRDRQRDDHVTFTARKTNNRALSETVVYDNLFCNFFAEKLKETSRGRELLASVLSEKYRCSVLLGRYSDADDAEKEMKNLGCKPSLADRLCRISHSGQIAWFLARNAIKIRWKIKELSGKPQV